MGLKKRTKMKTSNLHRLFIQVILLGSYLLIVPACDDSVEQKPTVNIYINNTLKSDTTVTKNTSVELKFVATSQNEIERVELYRRDRRQLPVLMQSFEKRLNEVNGTKFEKTLLVDILDETSYSIFVIDTRNAFQSAQVDIMTDIREYSNLTLYDARPDGSSKSFLNANNGVEVPVSYTKTDPEAIDFGFIYKEMSTDIKAAFVSFSDFHKTLVYPMLGNGVVTTFRKTNSFNYTSSQSLQEIYESAQSFSGKMEVSESKIAYNLQTGDIISFKTHTGQYGLINILGIDRKAESEKNEQSINFDVVIQR